MFKKQIRKSEFVAKTPFFSGYSLTWLFIFKLKYIFSWLTLHIFYPQEREIKIRKEFILNFKIISLAAILTVAENCGALTRLKSFCIKRKRFQFFSIWIFTKELRRFITLRWWQGDFISRITPLPSPHFCGGIIFKAGTDTSNYNFILKDFWNLFQYKLLI